MAAWVIPAISGAAQIIGSLIGSGSASSSANKAMATNRELARLNYQYGEMGANQQTLRNRAWYEQYSSPEALRKQYEAAGLNPALMNGGGAGSAGTLAQAGNGTSGNPSISPVDFEMVAQQKKMNNIQTGLAIAQMIKTLSSSGMDKAQTAEILQRMGFEKEVQPLKTENLMIENKYKDTQNNMLNMQITEQEIKNWIMEETKINQRNTIIAEDEIKTITRMMNKLDLELKEHEHGYTTETDKKTGITKIIQNKTNSIAYTKAKIEKLIKENELTDSGYNLRKNKVQTEEIEKLKDIVIKFKTNEATIKEFEKDTVIWTYRNKTWTSPEGLISGIADAIRGN